MEQSQPLDWYEDPHRGGWTGVRPGVVVDHARGIDPAVVEARITRQADAKRPWLARCRTGWAIDYRDDELDRAKESMDAVWHMPKPQPTPRELAMFGDGPRRRGGKLKNRPIRAPHPGALPRPPRPQQ